MEPLGRREMGFNGIADHFCGQIAFRGFVLDDKGRRQVLNSAICGNSHYLCHGHSLELQQDGLQFGWGDVKVVVFKGLLKSIDDVQVAVGIKVADVATLNKPVSGEKVPGETSFVVVALEGMFLNA